MPLTNATLNLLGTELDSLIDAMSLHNGDPGTTGANEISGGGYTRETPAFTVDADGDLTLDSAVAFTGTASQAVTHVGLWGSGTFRSGHALAGDAAFSSGGEYNVASGTITGTSSS
jgi:hypothetical protein